VHRGECRTDAHLIAVKPELALKIIASFLDRLALTQAEAFALTEAMKALTPPPPPKTEE
jgi:hypothetical protein